MKLEIKHLAPYLPFSLKGRTIGYQNKKETSILLGIIDDDYYEEEVVYSTKLTNITTKDRNSISCFTPILRPISDIDSHQLVLKHFFNKEKKGVLKEIQMIGELKYDPMECNYKVIEMLISEHFDVFGLIKQGLAISIHDVGQADA